MYECICTKSYRSNNSTWDKILKNKDTKQEKKNKYKIKEKTQTNKKKTFLKDRLYPS